MNEPSAFCSVEDLEKLVSEDPTELCLVCIKTLWMCSEDELFCRH